MAGPADGGGRVVSKFFALLLAGAALVAAPALAAPAADGARDLAAEKADGIPAQLDAGQRESYRAVFAAIHEARWQDAQLLLDGMTPGLLHAIARAELYTAHGSPKVEAQPIVDLLTQAPELPEAEQLARLARAKGAVELPALPVAQHLLWLDGAPNRARAKSVRSDAVAADLAAKMQPFVKDDQGAPAQALLESTEGLSPDALTEWRQKVGWIYYLQGDDADARAMEAMAAAGSGDGAFAGGVGRRAGGVAAARLRGGGQGVRGRRRSLGRYRAARGGGCIGRRARTWRAGDPTASRRG